MAPRHSRQRRCTSLVGAAALAALLLPGVARAQAPLPAQLTLDEALTRAAANSHRLGELRAREGAAGAVVDQQRAADNPAIAVQAGYQRTNHVQPYGFVQNGRLLVLYPDVPDNWRSRLDLQWPIYTGGRTAASERAAIAEREASGRDVEQAHADLRLETTRAFWALVTATEAARVVEESVARVEAQLRDVRARFEAGFLPPNDVLTVESQVAQQQTLLIGARNQRDASRAELARLIGAPVDADFALDATLALPPAAPVLPPSRRADLVALELRAEAAAALVDAARAESRPTVAIIGGVDLARPNPRIFPRQDVWEDSWDLGINVTWTLWNAGRTAAQVAEATHRLDAARERTAELDSQIALEVRQRQLDVASALAQVATAELALRSAVEARRVVAERFSAGVASSTDLLDAQVDQLEAALDRTRAMASVKLAEARLARALGH
jgi:outer membrane protein